jgi:hypothetical protein
MLHTQLTERVRELVRSELSQWGLDGEEPHETILIAQGHYAGRRFEASCGYALWFLEESQVKIYRASGELAKSVRLGSGVQDMARAA